MNFFQHLLPRLLLVLDQLVYIMVVSNEWNDHYRPIVRLQQGTIQGVKILTDSGGGTVSSVNSFLGIPYAAPPVADLRFAPPQNHQGWNGTLQTREYGPRCPQLPLRPGQTDREDCLTLNIWTPGDGVFGPLPVVVFFEGKDFYESAELPISGQDLAAEKLVVVTVNYRLNVFGFFCLGSSEVRGNYGMLDQYLSLLWIKKHIKEFGGDPEKITLYGHYSGAASVTFHMVSPRTAGLFQRAIISHGCAITPWQLHNDPTVASREIIRMLGCDIYSVNPVACLRKKKVEHVLQALAEYSESLAWNDRFLPVVDSFLPESNRYLPDDPLKAFKDGTYLQVPILTGISKPLADLQYMQWLELASQGYLQLQQYIEKVTIPDIVRLYKFNATMRQQISELIKWKYFALNRGNLRATLEQLKSLEFQAKIEAPHYLQLSYLVGSYVQPIYAYFFDDVGFVFNSTDSIITTELLLVFGPVLLKQVGRRRFNQNEENLSRTMKQLWTNFIKFGNPTPDNRITVWNKYTAQNDYVKNLASFGYRNERNSNPNDNSQRYESTAFWNQLLPTFSRISNDLLTHDVPREFQNSPDPSSGFRHALYTLGALVIALLFLLLFCIVLLRKRSKERESHLHMTY